MSIGRISNQSRYYIYIGGLIRGQDIPDIGGKRSPGWQII
ncbi:hypothetical protein ASZ90_018102 [hydrocarbon metagenome]|uniref:Uncharacterized protein n=1 Tax=hydrocarbon metagenome TaxID=938273 RepID=A0A0W8E784_9ZZZZ